MKKEHNDFLLKPWGRDVSGRGWGWTLSTVDMVVTLTWHGHLLVSCGGSLSRASGCVECGAPLTVTVLRTADDWLSVMYLKLPVIVAAAAAVAAAAVSAESVTVCWLHWCRVWSVNQCLALLSTSEWQLHATIINVFAWLRAVRPRFLCKPWLHCFLCSRAYILHLYFTAVLLNL